MRGSGPPGRDARRRRGSGNIDIWKLRLDGTGKDFVRLTHFNDYEGWKASNPVVSTDGRFMAFQTAKTTDPAGVGTEFLVPLQVELSARRGAHRLLRGFRGGHSFKRVVMIQDEDDDHGQHAGRRERQQPARVAPGDVFDPAHGERAGEAGEVADRVDHRDPAGRRGPGKECRREGSRRRAGS